MFSVPTFEALEERIGLNTRQISILLISLSMILWSISMLFSKVIIGPYGLISGINPLFFVSMSILIISFFITIQKNIEDNFLLALHLSLVIFFFASITFLIEGTPRFPYNFETSVSVDYIIQNGHSNSELIHYQTWPGVFYFGAIETLITNISPLNSILVIPLWFIIPNTLFLFLLYSTFLNKKETWTALLLSNALIFGAPIYFLPGVICGIMTSYAILMFFRFEVFSERASIGSRIIFIIFCSTAVVSHFLSSVYFLFTLISISGLSYLFKHKLDKKFILVFVLIVAFQVYVAGSYALENITGSIHDALNMEKTVNDIKNMAYSGSEEHSNVVNVRIISTLILLILAGVGFFYEILIKKRLTLKNLSLPTWAIANSTLTVLTSYSGEIVSRTFAASLSIFNMLTAKLIDNKKLSIILLLVLIISPPLSIINAYGNEAIDYVSPVEISGATFLFDHSVNSTLVYSLHSRAWSIQYNTNLTNWGFDLSRNAESYKDRPSNKNFNNTFIQIGIRDIENYEFVRGNSNLINLTIVETSTSFNKIFDNEGFSLYKMRA